MPIYEYQCQKCKKTFEYMQSMSDAPKKKCERKGCGGKLEKLISASGFVLKGGGWYKDLYSSSKPDKADSSSAESTPSETKPAEAKTDSKVEKAESKPEKSESKPPKKAAGKKK